MRFIVEGADAKTGKDRRIEVDADDERSAVMEGKGLGIFPYKVSRVADEVPEFVENDGDANGRQVSRQLLYTYGVFVGLLTVAAIAIIAYFGRNSEETVPLAGIATSANQDPKLEPWKLSIGLWTGKQIWLGRDVVAGKDKLSFKKELEIMYANDKEAFAALVLRGDAVFLKKGSKVTVVTVPPEGATFLTVRPEGSPDDVWVLSEWLE